MDRICIAVDRILFLTDHIFRLMERISIPANHKQKTSQTGRFFHPSINDYPMFPSTNACSSRRIARRHVPAHAGGCVRRRW